MSPRHRLKPQQTRRLPNSELLLGVVASAVAACSTTPKWLPADIVPPDARVWMLSDYCWSPSHFVAVDLDRAELLQLINNDLVLYTVAGDPDMIHCAYPVDNQALKRMAQERGVRHTHVLRVTL